MRRWLQLTVGIIVACLFLYVAVRNVDLAKAITALSSVQLHQMTPIIVLSFMILWLRVWRWQLMFPSSSRPSGIAVFRAFAFGAFGNCVMPGRLGDLARAGIISRDVAAMGVSGALATVVVEKVMDGLAVLVLLAFALWFTPLPTWLIRTGLVATAILAVALAFLFIVAKQEALSQTPLKLRPASSSSSKLIMALRRVTHRFSNGLRASGNSLSCCS